MEKLNKIYCKDCDRVVAVSFHHFWDIDSGVDRSVYACPEGHKTAVQDARRTKPGKTLSCDEKATERPEEAVYSDEQVLLELVRMTMHQVQEFDTYFGGSVHVTRVPGGWIYRQYVDGVIGFPVFVPKPAHLG